VTANSRRRRERDARVDVGPGYRIYYCRREERTYLLLAGGDKSTQDRDIKRAKEMVGILKKETKHEKGKKGEGKN
jgi:putative addiction module killer protein